MASSPVNGQPTITLGGAATGNAGFAAVAGKLVVAFQQSGTLQQLTWGSGGFDLDAIGVLNARIEISADPAAPPPDIPGYVTIKEYTPTLYPAVWTNILPETNIPGFYRYRRVK